MVERYERAFSFAGFQANQPKAPLPGQRADIEFDAIARALRRYGGASAYDLAVLDGFVGDERAWLDSLRSTVPGPPGTKAFPIQELGFVGDGAQHPLSQRFATLAQAQSAYPRAAALTEQIDQHAIQRYIDVEVARRPGAASVRVDVPPGTFCMHSPFVTDGNVHVRMQGAGIKATTALVVTPGAKFWLHGKNAVATGTLTVEDIQIENASGDGFSAFDVNSYAVPSMGMRNVQVNGFARVLEGFNILCSRFEKVRAYYPKGIPSEADRTTSAWILRQNTGCFLNIWIDCQTEGYAYAFDIVNSTQPGYEGQYFRGLNVNSGTHVATIRSDVPGYDAPQWTFTDLEIEVSGSWFDLNNLASVSIDVDFGLTYQGSSDFSVFNLVNVIGADINVDQLKSFSFPNFMFNLISNCYGVTARVGVLRVESGGFQAGLTYFGPGSQRCVEKGVTFLTGWDYTKPFATGPNARTQGCVSVHDVKYLAEAAGLHATVDAFGPSPTVTLAGAAIGTTGANGDLAIAIPDRIFQSAPVVQTSNGDGANGGESVAPIFASITKTGFTARLAGAPSGATRRVSWLATGI